MNPEQGSRPQSEEPESYVKNPELSQEMAEAEIPMRDKLKVAAEIGLSEEAINSIGNDEEVNKIAEKRREAYAEAMHKADAALASLLKNGQTDARVGTGINLEFADLRENRDLMGALQYRVNEIRDEKIASKIFKIGNKYNCIKLDWYENMPGAPRSLFLKLDTPTNQEIEEWEAAQQSQA